RCTQPLCRWVDLHGNDQGAVENPRKTLPPMEAHLLRTVDRLPTGDTDGVFLGLDIQVFFVHSRQLDNGDEVVTLLENIHGWIGARAGSGASKPVAGKTIFRAR